MKKIYAILLFVLLGAGVMSCEETAINDLVIDDQTEIKADGNGESGSGGTTNPPPPPGIDE